MFVTAYTEIIKVYFAHSVVDSLSNAVVIALFPYWVDSRHPLPLAASLLAAVHSVLCQQFTVSRVPDSHSHSSHGEKEQSICWLVNTESLIMIASLAGFCICVCVSKQ